LRGECHPADFGAYWFGFGRLRRSHHSGGQIDHAAGKNRRDRRINIWWRTQPEFQAQLRAHYRASRGTDDKIGGFKIDSLTRETIHQTNLPSPTHGTAAAKHQRPRNANCTALICHLMAPHCVYTVSAYLAAMGLDR